MGVCLITPRLFAISKGLVLVAQLQPIPRAAAALNAVCPYVYAYVIAVLAVLNQTLATYYGHPDNET